MAFETLVDGPTGSCFEYIEDTTHFGHTGFICKERIIRLFDIRGVLYRKVRMLVD